MTSRFYVSPPLAPGEVPLDDSEARHCFSVMRAREGDEVEVFDGEGRFAQGTLLRCDRKRVVVAVDEVRIQEAPDRSLHLLVSLPKGDRQKWLVEKCVELNVTALVPLVTSRSVAQPTDKALGRLRRTAIEASKQCGRNHLMDIRSPGTLNEAIHAPLEQSHRLIAHPYEASPLVVPDDARPIFVLIGPEGGFSDEEVQEAVRCDWRPVSLGDTILRVETAALTIAAAHFLK